MDYPKITFKTEAEADAFKVFLNWKAIRHAHTSDRLTVTVRDMAVTHQVMFELGVMFGKWW